MRETATRDEQRGAAEAGSSPNGVMATVLALTEQLSAANDHDDVARIVATTGTEWLGASAGFVAVATPDGSSLEMLSHVRADQPRTPLCSLDAGGQLPVAEAWRFGVPILVGTAAELYARYPALDQARGDRQALAALPLEVDGRRVGAINFTFAEPQAFDEPQLQVLRVVAGLCAQALRRAQLTLDIEGVRRDFAITAAHELRSPLTAIYAAAVALASNLGIPESARAEMMNVIVSQSRRLAQVVQDLDLTADLDAAGPELTTEAVDVAALLEEVVALQLHLGRSEGRVFADIGPGIPSIAANRARLQQVLVHLVDNACKYSPEDTRVCIRARLEGAAIDLRVLDRGPGVDADDRVRAFDKFFRADAMQVNGVSGIGLGLYVSRRLVEAMGGTIWLEPRADGLPGTAACVRLPIVGHDAGAAPEVR